MKKHLPEITYWSDRELRQAAYWKTCGFSIADISKALGKSYESVKEKWDEDGFTVEVRPPVKKICLSCNSSFDSDGPHNRLCEACRLESGGIMEHIFGGKKNGR